MKTTETILLLGLGGVIAYLVLGKKNGQPSTKSLGGGGGGGSRGNFEDSTKSLEAIDVIETKPPINVTVNTTTAPVSEPTTTPDPSPPQPTNVEPEDAPTTPSAAFVSGRRRKSDGYSQQFVILDNTNFPIHRAYNGDEDVDCY